jgi:hypothetical protein
MGEGWEIAICMTSPAPDDFVNSVRRRGWRLTPTFQDNYYFSIRRYPHRRHDEEPLTFAHHNNVVLPVGHPQSEFRETTTRSITPVRYGARPSGKCLSTLWPSISMKGQPHALYVIGGLKVTCHLLLPRRAMRSSQQCQRSILRTCQVWAATAKQGMG